MDTIKVANDSLNVIVKAINKTAKETSCDFWDKDVSITLIICITVLAVVSLISAIWYYNNKAALEYEKEKQKAEKERNQNNHQKQPQESSEAKDRKEFINFCYEMVRSNDEKYKDIQNDCWTFLKSSYTNGESVKDVSKTTACNEQV